MSKLGKTAIEAAKEKGLVCIFPADDELFVDIDDSVSMAIFDRNLEIVQRELSAVVTAKTPSPSGRKYRFHVTVKIGRPVNNVERLLLQAVLGSDRTREALSFLREVRGESGVTAFFEKPVIS